MKFTLWQKIDAACFIFAVLFVVWFTGYMINQEFAKASPPEPAPQSTTICTEPTYFQKHVLDKIHIATSICR